MHLVISKDSEELKRVLNSLLSASTLPLIQFFPDQFSSQIFAQEVETLPFLTSKKTVVVHEIDQLSKEEMEVLCRFLEKPSPWISLYLSAKDLAPQNKLIRLVEKQGIVQRIKEEKPWEKEKRVAEWLAAEAKREGIHLSSSTAMQLVQSIDRHMLKSELDKLICFVYPRKEITSEDISLISVPAHHETLWHLGDALLARRAVQALEIGQMLLDEGMAIFPLLSHLRSQFSLGLEMLVLPENAAKKHSYLKGNLFEKKLHIFRKYGKGSLQKGILSIFAMEVRAKNSSTDPSLLLELLITNLTHATISSPQFARTH
jgi:DNA polymerase III delta subunit